MLKAIDRIALLDVTKALQLLQPSTAFTLLNNEFTALFDGADERSAVEKFDLLKAVASVSDGNESEIEIILSGVSTDVKDTVTRCAQLGSANRAFAEVQARLEPV